MKKQLAIIILLLSFTPLFFFKLGQSSLTSFDEAWYAAISKNILLSKNPINLTFNNKPFVDHPPVGFIFMAISQLFLGFSEFSARLPSAIFGILSLFLIYQIGKSVSSSSTGIASAFSLASTPWFLLRSRSGNLDITLTFLFLLTFYWAFLFSKNSKYKIPFSVSLICLILTKTMVPFTIIPSLTLIFWGSRFNYLLLPLTFTLIVTITWILSQIFYYPNFFQRYVSIGLPENKSYTTLWQNILLTKTYLHHGIGSIFRPLISSFPFSIFLFTHPKFKYFLSLLIFILVFLLPFASSSRGQIWHLIPIFPFLILSFYIILYSLISKISIKIAKIVTLTLTLTLSIPQITKNWYEFIDIPKFVSDEAILSTIASKYPYPLVIDENFLPSAVYYSGKEVVWNSSRDLSTFTINNKPTLVITHQWLLDQNSSFTNYQVLAKDRDKVLILTSDQSL